jgi:glycosyltransferase involved in cell wall biosynthesis
MKFVFVIDSLGPGGAEKSMVDLAIFLKNRGDDIKFMCIDKRNVSFASKVIENDIPLHYFKSTNLFSKSRELANFLQIEKPDIVHSVLIRSNLIVRISRVFYNSCSYVESLVNLSYSKIRRAQNNLPLYKSFIVKKIDQLSAKCYPPFFHAISEEVLKNYKSLYGIKGNYQIIYRGRQENTAQRTNKENSLKLLNIGRQEFAKGQINLLKAIQIVRETTEINFKLIIFGHSGKATPVLKSFIKNHSLQEVVEIQGFVDNIEQELKNSDIFIFPSYHEGLGGALIEAFAAGLPCICADIPVLRELSGRGDQPVIFIDPENHQLFASKIIELINEEQMRKTLSERALIRFTEKFQLESINFQMLQMYKSLLDKVNG